ncbi:integral membrane protein GPR155-like protein [Leptotrombidium deliense]|uniref:Integral membrane protein GPR155-like protein n=1 Tax=Leptotrombidium deliense TaxID=299467 RepID=A0A443SKE5_9ACAR|nr:integral membrane protein GPR155-like protein [Leptotrombidium deliense]
MYFIYVIIESFAVILVGYFSGKWGLISEIESIGLSRFVTYYSLPALIFKSLATFSLADVDWYLVFGIFLAKAILFVGVAITTVILTKPRDYSKAGLYGIFCTQSNDFAVGYPLLISLYNKIHPNFPNYVYLLAPVQLLMINPFGVLMMEIQRHLETNKEVKSAKSSSLFLSVMKGIMKNPIVLMTALGIIWSLIFNHQLPLILRSFLETLSMAFSATALFLLGLSLCVNQSSRKSSRFLVLSLVCVKIVLLPLLIKVLLEAITPANKDPLELSSFGFLYGTFPAAPTAFIIAVHQGVSSGVVASGMALTTLLSAPLMIVSGNMIAIRRSVNSTFDDYLEETMSVVSLISIICIIYTFITLLSYKMWIKSYEKYTFILLFSQLITAIGGYLSKDVAEYGYQSGFYYMQCVLALSGLYMTRIWTVILAVSLTMAKIKHTTFSRNLNSIMITTAVLTTVVLSIDVFGYFLAKQRIENIFQFSRDRSGISIALSSIALLISSLSMVVYHHLSLDLSSYQSLEGSNYADMNNASSKSESNAIRATKISNKSDKSFSIDEDFEISVHIKEMNNNKHIEPQIENGSAIQNEKNATPNIETVPQYDTHDDGPFVTLVLLLIISIVIGVTVSIGNKFHQQATGIFMEIEFLDIVLCYGQGIISFLLFCLNSDKIYKFIKRVMQCKRSKTN